MLPSPWNKNHKRKRKFRLHSLNFLNAFRRPAHACKVAGSTGVCMVINWDTRNHELKSWDMIWSCNSCQRMQHLAQHTGSLEWCGIFVSGSMEIQFYWISTEIQVLLEPSARCNWHSHILIQLGMEVVEEEKRGVARAEEEGDKFSESSVGSREQGSEAGTQLWSHGTQQVDHIPFPATTCSASTPGMTMQVIFFAGCSTKVRRQVSWYSLLCSVSPMAQKQSQILESF